MERLGKLDKIVSRIWYNLVYVVRIVQCARPVKTRLAASVDGAELHAGSTTTHAFQHQHDLLHDAQVQYSYTSVPRDLSLDSAPQSKVSQTQRDANHASLPALHAKHRLLLEQELLIAFELRHAREVAVSGQTKEGTAA